MRFSLLSSARRLPEAFEPEAVAATPAVAEAPAGADALDAPIRVRDGHWGACRTAYQF